jgi:beta-lactamase superfamily II metal-dependent hydrolase
MPGDVVKVSMYNVGFGDCFLLRFPGPDRERTVLIDCGSIKQGIAGATDVIVKQVIEDVTTDGVPRIDVVAMSHRHKDHVSGFGDEAWRNVEVGEVWLPWIENPGDERARQILHEMATFALSLQREVSAARTMPGISLAEQELLDHVIGNTLTLSNEKAMATLHRGFKAGERPIQRRFLARSDTELASDALPGVTVHVLGPSKDEEAIRDVNPPSSESFLQAAAGFTSATPNDLLPFPESAPLVGQPSEMLKDILRSISHQSALLGAVALESAVNNTSLMLVFEIGEAVLLFPGDSQWGSWKINLEDPLRRELLERTTFYKIGHHGSHNATPVTFVDGVINRQGGPASEVWAAASVTPHGRFTEIPKLTLLKELIERIGEPKRVVRSDKPPSARSAPDGLSVLRKSGKAIRLDFELPVSG